MKSLRKYLDRIKPQFEPGGRLHAFQSVFDGFETFLFTPTTTSRSGVNIHDSLDSKRVMIIVVLALVPCLLFGMSCEVLVTFKPMVSQRSQRGAGFFSSLTTTANSASFCNAGGIKPGLI